MPRPRIVFSFFGLMFLAFHLAGCSSEYLAERGYWHASRSANEIIQNPFLASSNLYAKTQEALTQVAERYPETLAGARSRLLVGRLLMLKKEYEPARSALDRVVSQYRTYADVAVEAQFAVGQTYEMEGNWAEALRAYRKAIEDHPNAGAVLPIPLFLARKVVEKEGLDMMESAFDQALEDYELIKAQTPEAEVAAVALSLKAECYVAQGKPRDALLVYNEILERYPESRTVPTALLHAAQLYDLHLQSPDDAIRTYELLSRRLADNEEYQRKLTVVLGGLNVRAGRMAAARDLFSGIIHSAKEDDELVPIAYMGLGLSYEKEGNWGEALKIYQELVQDYPNTMPSLQVQMRIANYYEKAGQTTLARKAHLAAIENYKGIIKKDWSRDLTATAQDFISLSYALQGDWAAVVMNLEEVIAAYPNSHRAVTSYFAMAAIYNEKLREREKAILTYKKILSSFPDSSFAQLAEVQLQQLVAHQ